MFLFCKMLILCADGCKIFICVLTFKAKNVLVKKVLFRGSIRFLTALHSSQSQKSMIHQTAIVSPKAKLGDGVRIGPYCVVGEHVTLGDRVVLHSHVVIEGRTTLGDACAVYPFASIGHAPQDMKYAGEPSTVSIGAKTVVREYVTVQPGTKAGLMATKVGSSCLLMASTHVAHDCIVGDHVVMANNATLAGHVVVGDGAVIGGLAAIHQFVRIGKKVMVSGTTGISRDVIPYGMVGPQDNTLSGLNVVGLKRQGTSQEAVRCLRRVYGVLFEDTAGTRQQRIEALDKKDLSFQEVQDVLAFIQASDKRPLCLP